MSTIFSSLASSSTGISGNLVPLLVPLVLLELVLVIFALVDVIRRDPRQIRGNKAVWIVVILLIGTLGPICYLVAGRKEVSDGGL